MAIDPWSGMHWGASSHQRPTPTGVSSLSIRNEHLPLLLYPCWSFIPSLPPSLSLSQTLLLLLMLYPCWSFILSLPPSLSLSQTLLLLVLASR